MERTTFIMKDSSKKKNKTINYNQIITLLISILALLFTIYSYRVTQLGIDKRHFKIAYFDERYKVIKDVCKSIADINKIFTYSQNCIPDSSAVKTIRSKTYVFGYSYIVLKEKTSDTIILNKIADYESQISKLRFGDKNFDCKSLKNLGKDIIISCSKILNDEKDTINSATFSFF